MFEKFRQSLAKIEDLLEEISEMKTRGAKSSIQTARNFYSSDRLGTLLDQHLFQRGVRTQKAAGELLGMGGSTVKRIVEGRDISENMLFRLEQYLRTQKLEAYLTHDKVEELAARPWRLTSSKDTQEIISDVAKKLTALLTAVAKSNSLGRENSIISEVERAQLVAMLEATLATLKSPAIKAEETVGLFNWLKRLARRSLEKQVERSIGDALSSAAESGAELIENLANQTGITDLDKLI